jgi:hypothetical protein
MNEGVWIRDWKGTGRGLDWHVMVLRLVCLGFR